MFLKKYFRKKILRLLARYTTEELIERGLVVGKNFKCMHGVIIDPSHVWHIHIGNNVTLAPRVHILAHDTSTYQHLGYTKIGNVTIGDNVFVGVESVILPNVRIGDNAIIGANSTVSRDIPANTVAAGSPAKVICSLEDFIDRNKQLMATSPVFENGYTLTENISMEARKAMREKLEHTKTGFVR